MATRKGTKKAKAARAKRAYENKRVGAMERALRTGDVATAKRYTQGSDRVGRRAGMSAKGRARSH